MTRPSSCAHAGQDASPEPKEYTTDREEAAGVAEYIKGLASFERHEIAVLYRTKTQVC